MEVDELASVKKLLIGEIELNGVEIFTVMRPEELGQEEGSGVSAN